jgi:hypothetical protein
MEKQNYNCEIPLNMDTFKELTNNASSIEEEVIDLFFMNATECLVIIEKTTNDNLWLFAVKEIKELAKCVGAEQMMKTCSIAEDISVNSTDTRNKIFANLQNNLEILKVFVRNTRY